MHRKDRLFCLKKIIFDCYNLFKSGRSSVFRGQRSVFSGQYSVFRGQRSVRSQSLTTDFCRLTTEKLININTPKNRYVEKKP